MGIVWEAYHKGVPLLGVPENPIEVRGLVIDFVGLQLAIIWFIWTSLSLPKSGRRHPID